ncbi:MAG: hypothetical protein ABH864_07165 [archaeon]
MIKGKKEFLFYWIFSWIFVVFFGEFLAGIVAPILNNGQGGTFFIYPIQIIIFYGFANLIIAFALKFIPKKLVIMVFFIYGAILEMVLWRNVKGPTDIIGIIFFGLLYVFLYGVPYWITKRRYKEKKK